MPIITLTTDFRDSDGYTGIMKGVMAGIAPEARVIDIAHAVRPGDIVHVALVVRNTWLYYPPGSIHLVIVDPGVGSERGGLVIHGAGQYFVGPDNGVFSWVVTELAAAGEEVRAWRLEDDRFRLTPVSGTFHGRDIFAPAAAFLARGVDPEELGPSLDARFTPDGELTGGPLLELLSTPDEEPGTGRVMTTDAFGNVITTIEVASLPREMVENPDSVRIEVESGQDTITLNGIRATFSSAAVGDAVAVEGSSGLLEIVVNGGSAAASFGLLRGDEVRCRQ